MKRLKIFSLLSFLLLLQFSCIEEKNLYAGPDENYSAYLYDYKTEVTDITAEFTLTLSDEADADQIEIGIPPLKYNKSWLFLLTQDDCMQAAYCVTWAAINNKPIANVYSSISNKNLFYSSRQLYYNDIPTIAHKYNKALGSTDGAGNEVRFAFTTTVSAEEEPMNVDVLVAPGYMKDEYRFFMKKMLDWDDVRDILTYGNSIAFHDVLASNVQNATDIASHLGIAQNIIQEKLSGRICKVMAEPNGNKTYIEAAKAYEPIKIMTAQTGATKLYPFKVTDDLRTVVVDRRFYESSEDIKAFVSQQAKLAKEEREAISIGVHSTDPQWTDFLLWLNNTYGKDGDDTMWFPSLEEYYEYNYYRIHSNITKKVEGNVLKVTITMPAAAAMYYPSLTVNLKGLTKNKVKSITSTDNVTGLSFGDYEEGLMLNMDCRKHLVELATHFVEKYEANKTAGNESDALYFVNMLKTSSIKSQLLKRIETVL